MRFYPLTSYGFQFRTNPCTYIRSENQSYSLSSHLSGRDIIFPLLLIAIFNDLSETEITFRQRGVQCVDVSANRGHGVRGKWKYSSAILSIPLKLLRTRSLVRSATKSLLSEGVHVILLKTVKDRSRTWRIFFYKTLT